MATRGVTDPVRPSMAFPCSCVAPVGERPNEGRDTRTRVEAELDETEDEWYEEPPRMSLHRDLPEQAGQEPGQAQEQEGGGRGGGVER